MAQTGTRFDKRPTNGETRPSKLTDFLTRLPWFSRKTNGNGSLRESLEETLHSHHTAEMAALSKEERMMLSNILSFGGLRVDDVMVPRADIIAVDVSTSLNDILEVFRDAAHSRLPIYRETLDDPIGMVHIKDVIAIVSPGPDSDADRAVAHNGYILNKLRRDVLFVPPSMPALDLLIRMQKTHIHLAIVIDEYGGTDGLVSIEDLVEQIVGEIEDEHDTDAAPVLIQREGGGFDADARVPVGELEDKVAIALLSEDREEDIDTLGGLIFSLVGRVPQRGELIRHPGGLEFEIIDADPRRVKKIRIHLIDPIDPKKGDPAEKQSSDTHAEAASAQREGNG